MCQLRGKDGAGHSGAVGTARALLFGAEIAEPLYRLGADGLPTPGLPGEEPSLLREYNRKLKYLPEKLYTNKAKKIAQKRQEIMDKYFAALAEEVRNGTKKGRAQLEKVLKQPEK